MPISTTPVFPSIAQDLPLHGATRPYVVQFLTSELTNIVLHLFLLQINFGTPFLHLLFLVSTV